MADSGAEPGAEAQPQHGHGRRNRHQQVQEEIDELAKETKRTTLLDREESQLKDEDHCTRLLCAFICADDRKVQNCVEGEFQRWMTSQETTDDVTGVLLFVGSTGLNFMEGPTEKLFAALTFMQGLSAESTPPKVVLNTEDFGKRSSFQGKVPETHKAPAVAKPSYINSLRVVYFSELHSVRTSISWCSSVHSGRAAGGGVPLEESNMPDLAFALYHKFLLLCLRVRDAVGNQNASLERVREQYRKISDSFPPVDAVSTLLGKGSNEFLFTYPEFAQVFIDPFHLVLHSELLWPMPPPLSY